jgi:Holliday junction resolvase RusA-like endonuclease
VYKDDRQIVNAEIEKIECGKGDERVEVEILEVERVV